MSGTVQLVRLTARILSYQGPQEQKRMTLPYPVSQQLQEGRMPACLPGAWR